MNFKRILALTLSLLMVFSGAASIFAADETPAAEEVVADSPYLAAAAALNNIGVVKGDENGDYKLDDNVTRWQMALFICRSLTGKTEDSYWGNTAKDYSVFTDITGTAANYLGAIGYANQAGVIKGWKDATTGKDVFGPDNGIMYQDALTMATRALGYTDLSYPWGNINKAVELGLDKGITGVGYQDELKRGEVIQVIYNMLNATVKGTNKSLKETALSLKEAVVVIVSGDEVKYATTNDLNKRDNYVSFSVLDADGKFVKAVDKNGKETDADAVYSISAAAFGIDKDTDPDAMVGYSYSVTTSDDFATFAFCEQNDTVTYWNLGKSAKTTEFKAETFNKDKKNEYTKLVIVNADDAKDLTDNYTIVDKYTRLTTIQGSKTGVEVIPGDTEILVYDPSGKTDVVLEEGSGYYTDAFGNILTVEKVWDATRATMVNKLTILYYYNATTKSYFKQDKASRYTYTDAFGNTQVIDDIVAYVPVTEKELAEKKINRDVKPLDSFVQLTTLDKLSSTYAYASLTLIDDYRNYEGYDRAIYKAFSLGYVKTSETKDDKARTRVYTPNGYIGNRDTCPVDVETSTKPEFVDALTGKTIDVADKTWVLFYYNYMTNTIEVLETLKVEKGILKGWDIDKKTVTIGTEKFSANYDTLKNTGITYKDDANKNANKVALNGLYSRSINYIVIDDEVVWIEANATTKAGVVVLHSFLGITADGMLEFYAYTTQTPGSLQKIKVNAMDNWYSGYYSLATNNALAYANLFNGTNIKGQIFKIDAIDDAGVYYISASSSQEDTLRFDTYYRGVFDTKLGKLNNADFEVTSLDITTDTYFVFVEDDGNGVESVFTAKGNPADVPTWITGDFYWATSKMIVVKVDEEEADYIRDYFNTTANITFYYALKTLVPLAATSTDAMGNRVATYEGLVNIATGGINSVAAVTNLPIVAGNTYLAVDGVITEKVPTPVWTAVTNEFANKPHNSQYRYGGTVTVDYTPNASAGKNSDDSKKQIYEGLRDAFVAKVTSVPSVTTDGIATYITLNNLLKQNKNVTFRTASTANADLGISEKANGDIIAASATSKTYTIEYFYSATGAVAAYITKVIDTPAIVASNTVVVNQTTIVRRYANVAPTIPLSTQSTPGASVTTAANVLANKNAITFTYTDDMFGYAVAPVSPEASFTYDFDLYVLETQGNSKAYFPATVDLSGSILTFNADGTVATITFKNGAGNVETLVAGSYMIKNLVITEVSTTQSNSGGTGIGRWFETTADTWSHAFNANIEFIVK